MSFLDEVRRLQQAYDTDIRNTRYRALVYGSSGSGKTTSLRTARLPLLVHSFDPGGTKILSPLVREGKAVIDTSYENDNPKDPTAFANWDAMLDRLISANVFEGIGTYVLDSCTTWGQCALYAILKKAGRAGGTPQQNDWYPQMNLLEFAIRKLLTLPCDVILIAHDTADKDEVSGRISRGPLFTGKLTSRLPLMFDEVYYATGQQSSKGTEFVWQIRDNGTNKCKSRLSGLAAGRGIAVPDVIPQDFKRIIGAAGYPIDDLVAFDTRQAVESEHNATDETQTEQSN